MRYLQRGLTHHDTDRATPGFTLFTPLRNSTAYIVNMDGKIVHQWDLPAAAFSAINRPEPGCCMNGCCESR